MICRFTHFSLADIFVGQEFEIATLPNFLDQGTDHIYFTASRPVSITVEMWSGTQSDTARSGSEIQMGHPYSI